MLQMAKFTPTRMYSALFLHSNIHSWKLSRKMSARNIYIYIERERETEREEGEGAFPRGVIVKAMN